MVPITGKFSIIQYVKGKPCPWDIKIFVLCGSSGMAYDFIISQGSKTKLAIQLLSKFGLGPTVILKLSESIQRGRFLYFDNYFTTYNLLEVLRQKQIHGARTIRNAGCELKRKAGRPSSSTPSVPIQSKRAHIEVRIQTDHIDHMPEMDGDKEATRCEKPSC
ncbi:hypothetical protein JTB14_028236 [Gonioctena quinquepunctata]|nr:hypothetical protein JTB14_028236 [Gonioctena quinquepunctata]